MARITVYIDGFNVYHALENERSFHKYKWLDYDALARCYIGGRDTLVNVYLFTSFATWNQDKVKRHKDYLYVLKRRGVEIVMGKFKRKDRICRECHKSYRTFEEKLTDVNIAIHMFRGAYLDEYDKSILISGDTDIIPAIRMIQELFPSKQVGVVIPIGIYGEEMKQVCDFHFRMKEKQLQRSQLPDVIEDAVKGKIVRPAQWR